MVKSFWSGLQQARTEVPGTSRQSQHTTLFGTPKPCPVPCHSDNVKEIFSTNEQTPDNQVNRNQTKCPGCGCICKGGQQHTCSAIVMKDPTVNEMSPNSSDNYMSQDSPRKVFLSTQDGVVSSLNCREKSYFRWCQFFCWIRRQKKKRFPNLICKHQSNYRSL